ncbi:tRNA (guanosine(46)-N7)-methyltransferase TrmB [Motiliproteus sp. SC1-56]|uniref:tRNA (guanosine(46)-N7)-methyltransferase TrmB n=1 Tax=Motiliproteus sp. SC1-56 TaxID=2799565 RepID=UPI001F5C34C1|nr:tRNA (guanosine(46)-N7)-methyltransferase TrmB [Motiliproteus sp. SC1-56]
MTEETTPKEHLRSVRTFVIRAGRMTPAQEKALEAQWPVMGLELADGELDFEQAFGRQAPVVLEIGFGMGDSLLAMAEANSDTNYLGIEVHTPGVGRLLNNATKAGLKNLRVYREDALEVLKHCIPDASLDGIQLFFPDPWPKKKHHKRRMVQPAIAQSFRQKLKIGGTFHMATDWEPYAEHMMEVMSAAEGYRNVAGEGAYSPQPEHRPDTKFQRRGEKLGHGVWDLVFERVA